MASGTADFTVPNTTSSGLDAGDIALAYSCEAQAYFQVRSFAGGTITHAVGGNSSTAPGNATADVNYAFRTNAEVIPVQTVIYYIRASSTGPAGSTSLWRRIGSNTPEELVEGVEQMQLRFGVDTNGDEIVDTYSTATAGTDWNAVHSVEVGLLVRSIDQYGGDRDQETYQLLDVPVPAANDSRMREVFMATASLRNRMRVN
ncbi:MAG: PilW family protein [Steroidobacteraceae bacterium]